MEIFTRNLTNVYENVYVISGPVMMPIKEDSGKKYITYNVCTSGIPIICKINRLIGHSINLRHLYKIHLFVESFNFNIISLIYFQNSITKDSITKDVSKMI